MIFAAALCALLASLPFAADGPQRAVATPPVIRAVQHPFDPDWLLVERIVAEKCAGCHRPGCDRCDMTSYQAIVDGRSPDGERFITPGKPEKSLFWDYVVWNATADPHSDLASSPMMPQDQLEWLTQGQLDTLDRWIRNGALQYKLPNTCSPRPLLESDFPSARECKACHPKQYSEWSRSMHAYAQHSPVFEAFNLTLIERTGGTIGTFCSRCHTPIGTALGENGSVRNIHRSRLSMEGVTCVVCHRQSEPYYKSNARNAIVPGKLDDGCMFGPFDNAVDHRVTGSHPAQGAPNIKSSAFCGSCHDVTNPQGVRLEEAYSEWQNSPAAKDHITCQQCHMGPVQGLPIADCDRPLGRAAEPPGVDPSLIPLRPLSDHTFAGPDYSLLPDTEFPEKLDWMYEVDYRDASRLTPHQQRTLDTLRRRNRAQLKIADEKRYELLKNAACVSVAAPRAARPGGKVRVQVDVTSKVAGHSFPTGFTAERQVWIEIKVYDPQGRCVFASGDLDRNGDLRDSHSQYVEAGEIPYDKYLLNFQNKFAGLTQKGTDRTLVIPANRHLQPLNFIRPATGISASFGRPAAFRISKGSLPPLRTMGQSYPVRLPRTPGVYLLDVKLNFRHLPPVLLDAIGTPHLKHLLEIVVIDQHRQTIEVR